MSEPKQKPHTSRQDYATPPEFIAAAKTRLGITQFAHDFAASAENRKAPTHFDADTDALSVPRWELSLRQNGCPISGECWGWLNPPFRRITPWAMRCAQTREAGGQIALLVPAAVGSNWFRHYVHRRAFVIALNGRIAFDPERPTWGFPKDCILALYSPSIAPGFDVWRWKEIA